METESVSGLVEMTVKALVDNPALVRVTEIKATSATFIEVSVGPGDMGKIIGRHGRTADALRVLIDRWAWRARRKHVLELIDAPNITLDRGRDIGKHPMVESVEPSRLAS